jgi:uncharacterized protein
MLFFHKERQGQALKINVMNISEEGLSVNYSRDDKWCSEQIPASDRKYFVLESVSMVCTIKRLRETLFLEGEIASSVEATCSRCLEIAKLPIQGHFHYVLAPAAEMGGEELELSAEDMDIVYYHNEVVDLDPLMFEQLMLQLPMKILCRESCKGLCPSCGVNLNSMNCQCQASPVDERLAVLKKFKPSQKY